jgi:hypothetical protein
MAKKLIFLLLVLNLLRVSLQSSCHNGDNKPYCDLSKCPKVTCKGRDCFVFGFCLFLFPFMKEVGEQLIRFY